MFETFPRLSDCDCRVEGMKHRFEDDGRALSAKTEQMHAKMDFQVSVRLLHYLFLFFRDVLVFCIDCDISASTFTQFRRFTVQ